MDPQARLEVWQTVKRLAERGTTVLLTTQTLDEAEQLADRIAILHQGTIIQNGTLTELKQLLPAATVEYVEKQPTLEEVFLALVGDTGADRNHRSRHDAGARTDGAVPARKGIPMTTHVLGDTRVLTGRSLTHILRSPDTIITTAVTPIALMLLFTYVLGGAINTGSDESYIDYMLPGILLITIASGIAYTAYRLFLDMQGGIFERFQSMPIARSSVLWAHVLTSVVANLVSIAIVIGVALIMGFRTGASVGVWLAVAGILTLFTLALTWLAVVAGLSAKTVDGASAFSYPLIFLPVHQLGVRAHRLDARPGRLVRREPARDLDRGHHPGPVRRTTRRHRHLDRPRLDPRHPRGRLPVGHRHLPPQGQLTPSAARRPHDRAIRPPASPLRRGRHRRCAVVGWAFDGPLRPAGHGSVRGGPIALRRAGLRA